MMPIKKRKGSLGAEEKKEEGEEPIQQPPSAKRRKKSVIQYDPVEVCHELYDTIRNFKNKEGRVLCEAFIRVPKRRTEPDYYNAVTNPIDLLKIQHKLKSDEYNNVDQITADIELMVNNAKAYYKESSQEYIDACELVELFHQTKNTLIGEVPGERTEKENSDKSNEPGRSTDTTEKMEQEEDDTSSRDERASSVADDDNAIYEQLLSAVVTGKEGGWIVSEQFKILPPKSKYPEYYTLIKHPMDLHRVAQKIQSNAYTSLDEMVKDLNLIVTNAKTFNEPGSQVYKDAAILKKLIDAKRQEIDDQLKQMRLIRSERIRSRRSVTRQPRVSLTLAALKYEDDELLSGSEETGGTTGEPTEGEDESGAEGMMPPTSNEDDEIWKLYNAVRTHKSPTGQLLADPFVKLPNRKIYPDYYEEIKMPISLTKIEKKIQNGRYPNVEALAADLEVMFVNAKRYNMDESKLFKDAVTLQGIMRSKCAEQLSCKDDSWLSSGDVKPTAITKSRRPLETSSTTTEDRDGKKKARKSLSPEETLRRRLMTLYKTVFDCQVDGRRVTDAFLTLPLKKNYPDYFQVISEPIDMTVIETKIKADKYPLEPSLIADFELMFNNARHYNEENSTVYKDADMLERVLRSKIRSLGPLDGSPATSGKTLSGRSKPKLRSMSALSHKLLELYNSVKDSDDSHGRVMSTPFMKLPLKSEYPDYYEVIKRPVDMQRIHQRMTAGQYNCVEDMVSDFVLMFDNACKYNEPDSLIYKDALMLQRLCLEKKRELCADDDSNEVPDVNAVIQELMLNLFITTHNHADEEGRCYSDSLLELPAIQLPRDDGADVKMEVKVDGEEGGKSEAEATAKQEPTEKTVSEQAMKEVPTLERVKRNLTKNRYRRVDCFQQDMFEVFEYARSVSRTDSQIYEDAVELQMFFIKIRDEQCRNGETLLTPALSYTERHLVEELEEERKEKAPREQREEEEKQRQQEAEGKDKSHGMTGSEDSLDFEEQTYHVGDFVYIESRDREKSPEPHIVCIEKLWKGENGEQWLCGCWFFRPIETYHLATRKFLEKEVFKSDFFDSIPFSKILGRCYVMFVKDYFKMKPQGFQDKDIYVCESRYSSRNRCAKKIKIWQMPKNNEVKIEQREQVLTPVRVVSVFAKQLANKTDQDDNQSQALDLEREVVPVESNQPSTDPNCTLYEQYHAATGWFKLGDYVYVKMDEDKLLITRIDKMWTGQGGQAYIHGPYFIRPEEVEHVPTRLFYHHEVFRSSIEDTNPMTSIASRCMVCSLKDYCGMRITEVSEEHVYVCESKYIETEKAIKKLNKPMKKHSLSYKVCDDEILFFKKQIVPQKEPSPLLLRVSDERLPLDIPGLVDDTSQLTAESSFTDSCSFLGSGEFSDAHPMEPVVEKKKKQKKKAQISGYITYAAECRKEIQNQNPDLSFGEISKIVGAKWRGLVKKDKEFYENKARRIAEEQAAKQEAAERAFNDSLNMFPVSQSPMSSNDARMSPASAGGRMTPSSGGQMTAGGQGYQQFPQGYVGQQGLQQMQGQVGQQQMAPPPPPPRPPSPIFVTVPPRTQRVLHSQAYLKYIEGLTPESRGISDWEKTLTATPENTPLSNNGKLPIQWLANGVGHHDNAVSALWALRDLMLKDTLTVSRTLEFSQL